MTEETLATPLEIATDKEAAGERHSVDEPVVVYTAGTPFDGEIVRGILESEGIPVVLTQAASPILGQIFSIGEGQAGEILVAQADVERAEALIAAYSNQD